MPGPESPSKFPPTRSPGGLRGRSGRIFEGLERLHERAGTQCLGHPQAGGDGGSSFGAAPETTSKIVSKAEGRVVRADDREDAITAETVRVVATRKYEGGVTRIVENRQGIIGAAAGVDASNAPEGTVLLLPVDPDASARALATW